MSDSVFIKLGIAFILLIIFSMAFLMATILFSIRLEPFKYAVEYENINNNENIICKKVMLTGFRWRKEDGELVNIIGDDSYKEIENVDIEFGNNKYIFYGFFTNDVYQLDGNSYRTFYCTGWDILYPIDRNDPLFGFLYSKEYISKSETVYRDY